MKIGDEVYVHSYVDEIRKDVVIIRNEGGYFGTVPSEVNCSEKPNNSLDKDTNVRSKYDCKTCKHDLWHTPRMCGKCVRQEDGKPSMYAPKTEPQTDPCDGCVCDDGKHLMYCMNCKGIAWKTEPPKVEDEPQTDYTPDCPFCKRYGTDDCLGSDCRHYKTYKDEPQTMPIKKTMTGSKGERIEYTEAEMVVRDEPQTERSE